MRVSELDKIDNPHHYLVSSAREEGDERLPPLRDFVIALAASQSILFFLQRRVQSPFPAAAPLTVSQSRALGLGPVLISGEQTGERGRAASERAGE